MGKPMEVRNPRKLHWISTRAGHDSFFSRFRTPTSSQSLDLYVVIIAVITHYNKFQKKEVIKLFSGINIFWADFCALKVTDRLFGVVRRDVTWPACFDPIQHKRPRVLENVNKYVNGQWMIDLSSGNITSKMEGYKEDQLHKALCKKRLSVYHSLIVWSSIISFFFTKPRGVPTLPTTMSSPLMGSCV